MFGVAQLDHEKIDKQTRTITRGEHWTDPNSGKGKMVIYRSSSKEEELHSRHHELGHEIYQKHLSKMPEDIKVDKLYERSVREGWMGKVSKHANPDPEEFFCDAYAKFQQDPEKLKAIDAETFRFIQNMYISLETKDVFDL